MEGAIKKTYWPKELAALLEIAPTTLRKWSQELEKAGYRFLRDEFDRRAYVDHDIIALRQLQQYLANGMSYEASAKAVTGAYLRSEEDALSLPDNVDVTPRQDSVDRYTALESKVIEQGEQIDKLIEMNRQLFARLDEVFTQNQQLSEIAAASEDRDREREQRRDEQLTQILREIQETKAAANKSIWSRLFRS